MHGKEGGPAIHGHRIVAQFNDATAFEQNARKG